MARKKKPILLALIALSVAASFFVWRSRNGSGTVTTDTVPTDVADDSPTRQATMAEVIEMAKQAREFCSTTLDDYTATFVKQEVDTSGNLGVEMVIEMKVQTRLRNDTDDAPMRVYLKFTHPESYAGREVLWGEDLYEGQMAVHEVGFLMGLKTIWLDPNGLIAMQGQRYPISHIGLIKLVEKLIERGQKDIDNPDISVTITRDHVVDGIAAQLIQVRRAKPSADPDDDEDFSFAEITIDSQRQLILQYRSFGWPENDADGKEFPLLESYTYKNIKTNVGLSDKDFDYQNPAYQFP